MSDHSTETKVISLDFTIPWTYAETAYFLRMAEDTLRDRVKRGRDAPPRMKVGSSRQATVLFWPPSVLAWLHGHEVPSKPARRRGRPRKAQGMKEPRFGYESGLYSS